jgi:hypothetical protein
MLPSVLALSWPPKFSKYKKRLAAPVFFNITRRLPLFTLPTISNGSCVPFCTLVEEVTMAVPALLSTNRS